MDESVLEQLKELSERSNSDISTNIQTLCSGALIGQPISIVSLLDQYLDLIFETAH